MEVFINELSIQEQYENIDTFSKSVIEFTKVISKLRAPKCSSSFLKKGDFYFYRKAIYNEYFTKSLEKIRDKSIKRFFQNIVFDRSNPKDWQREQYHLVKDEYFSKTLKESITGQTLAEVTERKILFADRTFLLLNFSYSQFSEENITCVVKNNEKNIDIDCVENSHQIDAWIEKNCIEKLIVEDKIRFKKTTKFVKGASVYREINTGYYWYLDTLHKTHYELFDKNKNHIGESDLTGNIDESKKDSSKNGKIDI